mmetsp:Transcript_20124/g.42227  ORF Transcript_20124/g.42227 Transcript_20124/m.42227 type:complete len:211 (-) Transcript_20124:27-659(-)
MPTIYGPAFDEVPAARRRSSHDASDVTQQRRRSSIGHRLVCQRIALPAFLNFVTCWASTTQLISETGNNYLRRFENTISRTPSACKEIGSDIEHRGECIQSRYPLRSCSQESIHPRRTLSFTACTLPSSIRPQSSSFSSAHSFASSTPASELRRDSRESETQNPWSSAPLRIPMLGRTSNAPNPEGRRDCRERDASTRRVPKLSRTKELN